MESNLDESADLTTTEPAKPAAKAADLPVDPYPNRRKYMDGHVFNFPVDYWACHTEEEVREKLVSGGNESDVIEPHVALIAEALAFHETGFAKPPEG